MYFINSQGFEEAVVKEPEDDEMNMTNTLKLPKSRSLFLSIPEYARPMHDDVKRVRREVESHWTQMSPAVLSRKRSKLCCCWPYTLVRAVTGRRAPALPRRMSEWDIPILRPAVAVEIEPVAFVVVVTAPGLLPAIVPSLIAPLFAALLAPVVTVGVPRAAFLAVTRNLSVFQVWVSRTPLLGGPVFLLFHPVFHGEIAKHFLEPLARHFDITKGPDRGQKFPAVTLVHGRDQTVGLQW